MKIIPIEDNTAHKTVTVNCEKRGRFSAKLVGFGYDFPKNGGLALKALVHSKEHGSVLVPVYDVKTSN